MTDVLLDSSAKTKLVYKPNLAGHTGHNSNKEDREVMQMPRNAYVEDLSWLLSNSQLEEEHGMFALCTGTSFNR